MRRGGGEEDTTQVACRKKDSKNVTKLRDKKMVGRGHIVTAEKHTGNTEGRKE